MFNRQGYTRDEISKLGNAIVYLTQKIGVVSKTKLLKLIYLIDEHSVKKFGIPFFGLDYRVWQAGPVNQDIYAETSSSPEILKEYITLNCTPTGECFINISKQFDSDEFSENEISLMDEVIKEYGHLKAQQLVDLCHEPGTLWYKIAEEKGLLDKFKNRTLNTTNFEINLFDLVKNDEFKSSLYNHHNEYLGFSRRFKA